MLQTHNSEVQQVRTRASSPLARVFSKRAAWFSIVICLLLLAAIVGITQKDAGVYAAQAAHAVSFPKHAPSSHRPAHPSHAGRMMPTMTISSSSLSFTQSLAHPQVATQSLTIKNNGSRSLYWHVATPTPLPAWVSSYAPAKGTLGAGMTVQITFTVKPTQVGTYTTQSVLQGMDQQGTVIAGSPQTINLTLNVTQ